MSSKKTSTVGAVVLGVVCSLWGVGSSASRHPTTPAASTAVRFRRARPARGLQGSGRDVVVRDARFVRSSSRTTPGTSPGIRNVG